MITNLSNSSSAQLQRALTIRQQLDQLEGELAGVLGEAPAAATTNGQQEERVGRGRRTMSASARAKIAAAQRARWARQRGDVAASAPVVTRRRRRMSPEARARISLAAKARWARARAANR